MSNSVYSKSREHFAIGDINLIENDLYVALIDSNNYSPNFSSDEYLSDLPENSIISTSSNPLSGKSCSLGVFSCNDIVFNSVEGDNVDSLIIYQYTGNPETSILIVYLDESPALPFIPDGSAVSIKWATGDNKIFRL